MDFTDIAISEPTKLIETKKKKKSHECTYENVQTVCKKYGCELLMTKDRFMEGNVESINLHVKLACGCIKSMSFNKFVRRRKIYCDSCVGQMKLTGTKCFTCKNTFTPTKTNMLFCSKSCSATHEVSDEQKSRMSEIMLKKLQSPDGHISNWLKVTNDIKNRGIDIFREALKGFEIIRTIEYSKPDLLVRPTGHSEDNNWLPVQIKVTEKQNVNSYHFKTDNAIDMIMIFVCIDDERMWLMDGNNIKTKFISIGKYKSIYSRYEIKDFNNLSRIFTNYYVNDEINITFEEGNAIKNNPQRIRHNFRMLRENKVKFLKFRENIFGPRYFTIDHVKLKDKKIKAVTCYDEKYSKIVHLRKAKNSVIMPHEKGDFDFYWLNVDANKFYVIPEETLETTGHLATTTQKGNMYFNIDKNVAKIGDCEFDYDTICDDEEAMRLKKKLKIIE